MGPVGERSRCELHVVVRVNERARGQPSIRNVYSQNVCRQHRSLGFVDSHPAIGPENASFGNGAVNLTVACGVLVTQRLFGSSRVNLRSTRASAVGV